MKKVILRLVDEKKRRLIVLNFRITTMILSVIDFDINFHGDEDYTYICGFSCVLVSFVCLKVTILCLS